MMRVLCETLGLKGAVVSSIYESRLGTFREVLLDTGETKFIHVSELKAIEDN
jgi:hypothetical protein